jgi:hypothetical protein
VTEGAAAALDAGAAVLPAVPPPVADPFVPLVPPEVFAEDEDFDFLLFFVGVVCEESVD